MKKVLFYIVLSFSILPSAKAQYGFSDMVELTGVIMSSDSLRYLERVSITIEDTYVGTTSNRKGVFSIIAPKGSVIKFSSLGFKKEKFKIPDTLSVNRYSVIQLLTQDTFYLPTTIIRPLMTRQQFEREFARSNIEPDKIEIARRNTEMNSIRAMAFLLPKDGNESLDLYQRSAATNLYWKGGQPPGGITAMPGGGYAIDPKAFAEFFRAWKRGDYKRNK